MFANTSALGRKAPKALQNVGFSGHRQRLAGDPNDLFLGVGTQLSEDRAEVLRGSRVAPRRSAAIDAGLRPASQNHSRDRKIASTIKI
jgi:hypothetical protein